MKVAVFTSYEAVEAYRLTVVAGMTDEEAVLFQIIPMRNGKYVLSFPEDQVGLSTEPLVDMFDRTDAL